MGCSKVINKYYLDLEVARALSMDRRAVSLTTSMFLSAARKVLADHGEVVLNGLGKLRLVIYETGDAGNLKDRLSKHHRPGGKQKKFTVYFTKSEGLTEAINKRKKVGHYGQARRG